MNMENQHKPKILQEYAKAIFASVVSRDLENLKELLLDLDQSVYPNNVTKKSIIYTALYLAARHNDRDCVDLLLAWDAKIDYKVNNGLKKLSNESRVRFLQLDDDGAPTAIEEAKRNGHHKMATYLAEKLADKNKKPAQTFGKDVDVEEVLKRLPDITIRYSRCFPYLP